MILAAGTTLQSGKYVVQAVLHQTDLGTTFQAYHVYLDQKVVLQTLNPLMGGNVPRSNFPQLRQQFVEKAQQLARYPSNHRLRAIDLFEEKIDGQELPFVVLSFLPNQPPQKIGEWLAILPSASKEEETKTIPSSYPQEIAVPAEFAQIQFPESDKGQAIADKPAQSADNLADKPVARSQPQETSPQQVLAAANGKAAADVKSPAPHLSPAPAPTPSLQQGNSAQETIAFPAAKTSTTNGASTIAVSPIAVSPIAVSPIDAFPPQSRNGHSVRVIVQPKKRSPNLFLFTALIAGAMGAGMGFALRVHPAPEGKMPFNLNTGLFNRDQSFPAQGNWPIRETPADLMPSPSATQPSYSTEPALQYTPPIESYPSSGYVPPAAPIEPASPAYQPEPIANPPADPEPNPDRPANFPPASAPMSREPVLPPKPVAPPAPAAPAPAIDPPAAAPPPPAPAPIDPAPVESAPAPKVRPPVPRGVDQ